MKSQNKSKRETLTPGNRKKIYLNNLKTPQPLASNQKNPSKSRLYYKMTNKGRSFGSKQKWLRDRSSFSISMKK
jgi:hypothetical protein